MSTAEDFLAGVVERNPNEPEFHQAVQELAESVMPLVEADQRLRNERILERMVEPDRIVTFRVTWEADDGSVGHLWRTWGNPAFRPPTAPPSLPPPYLADGWERADLPEIGRWMLNRFDSDLDPHGSRAVSFVRLNS